MSSPNFDHIYLAGQFLAIPNVGTVTSETLSVTGSATNIFVPKGAWMISCGANTNIQYLSPTDGTTWRTMGAGGMVVSDGASVRLFNSGVTASSFIAAIGQ